MASLSSRHRGPGENVANVTAEEAPALPHQQGTSRRLQGRVAVITGASRGIGAAAARRLADEGASIVLNSFPSEAMIAQAQLVADDITRKGGSAIVVPADVSDEGAVNRLIATARDQFGDPDIMIANAAHAYRTPWADLTVEQWDEMFAVNARGTFLCARAVVDGMIRKRGGSIINLTSVTVHLGFTNLSGYVATKGAIIGFTRALAREVGKEFIRVNAVMPGAIRTEHEIELGGDPAVSEARAAERQCLPRRGYAEDLAGTFVFLASDDSAFITGQVIAVDGGWVHR